MQHKPVIEQTALTTRLTVIGNYREFIQHVLYPVGGTKLMSEWAQFMHRYIGDISTDTLTVHLPSADSVLGSISLQSLQERRYCTYVMPAVINGLHGGLMMSAALEPAGYITWQLSLHT